MIAPTEPSPALALEAATAIGYGIARRALWAGDRCTWFDAVPVAPGQNPAVSATTGAEVYGGTSGIGLFLAQLAARTGDGLVRRTSLGALRHARALAGELEASAPLGFYGGAAGVGAALILAARELGDEEPIVAALELLLRVPLTIEQPDTTDVVGGTAGTLLALVVAARALREEPRLLARAQDAAGMLIALGELDRNGTLSWSTMREKRGNLTGFAHGAAGIAHTLLALHAVAPDAVLHGAIAAAFAYERSTYDPARRNWPDLRIMPGQARGAVPFGIAWCHGAVGIARARLFAESVGGFAVGDDIAAALATTSASVNGLYRDPNADFTVCHGIFGMLDTLLDAVRSGRAAYAPSLATVVKAATERYHYAEQPWPSGLMTREQVDGFMLGTAGVGHVYLRLADPSVEPILAPR